MPEKTEQENQDPALPECVRSATLQYLRSMSAAGVDGLPCSDGSYQFDFGEPETESTNEPAPDVRIQESQSVAASKPTVSGSSPPVDSKVPVLPDGDRAQTPSVSSNEGYSPSLDAGQRTEQLNVIASEVAGCTRCEKLCASRTNTVFGVGSVTPRLVFFGEGPGADEDRLGEPFVGAAGKLLDKIIGAMTLSREEVYIMNTVKCRPPGNRNPNESELANCREYFEKQFDVLQPEFICCLGSVAARTLLETNQSVGRMRGKFFDYRGSRVIATYHPAYLLRTPSAKAHVWQDMKFLLKAMKIEL